MNEPNTLPFTEGTAAVDISPEPQRLATLQPMATPTPMGLIQMAIQQGSAIDLDRMERLMQMQERWDKEEARKAFLEAMAQFRANAPELHKNCTVDFTSAKGRTTYKHADLEEVSIPIGRVMGPLGLSFRFEPKQANGKISVTTILQHSMGHSEQITLEGAPDESGNKNAIQSLGSTITYLERYGLLAITGMAVKGQDSDGRGKLDVKGMPEEAFQAHIEKIRKAGTQHDLQRVYEEAYRAGRAEKDTPAVQAFIKEKDIRKKELGK